MPYTPQVEKLLRTAIAILDDELGNRSCNDFELPDTEENRQLIAETEAENVHVPVEEWPNHPDYSAPEVYDGKLLFRDCILTYILRKELGLPHQRSDSNLLQ